MRLRLRSNTATPSLGTLTYMMDTTAWMMVNSSIAIPTHTAVTFTVGGTQRTGAAINRKHITITTEKYSRSLNTIMAAVSTEKVAHLEGGVVAGIGGPLHGRLEVDRGRLARDAPGEDRALDVEPGLLVQPGQGLGEGLGGGAGDVGQRQAQLEGAVLVRQEADIQLGRQDEQAALAVVAAVGQLGAVPDLLGRRHGETLGVDRLVLLHHGEGHRR